MNTSHLVAAFATVLAACSVSPDTSNVSDPEYMVSSLTGGPPACMVGSSCYTGGSAYPCAMDPASGTPMCCITGCVDDSGYCQPGTNASLCGSAGAYCATCPGDACSIGVCVAHACTRAYLDNGVSCGRGVTCNNGVCR